MQVRAAMAQLTARTQPDTEEVLKAKQTLITDSDNPLPLSQRAFLDSSSSKVRALGGSSARTDLCREAAPAMAVPTAILFFRDQAETCCFLFASLTLLILFI